MTAPYPEINATPLAQGTADAALTPVIRTITFADLHDALRLGWDDFKAVPSHPVILCLYVIYPALSLGLVGMLLGYSVLPLLFPLVAGFVLIGPFAALGLYELSRRRELGEATSVSHAIQVLRSPSFGAMLGLGTLLLMIFVVWVATAQTIYVLTFGNALPAGIPDFVTRVPSPGVSPERKLHCRRSSPARPAASPAGLDCARPPCDRDAKWNGRAVESQLRDQETVASNRVRGVRRRSIPMPP
jgi:hypothetical protein